jgi:gamma-glutamyltranspeptidase / glutathione hydrolase
MLRPAKSLDISAVRPPTPEGTPRSPLAGRSVVYAPRDVIATSQPLASAAGLEVLRGGGNAIDAALAAAAVLAVVEPHMTGLGGDVFALFWCANEGRLVGLDATGRAGARMTVDAIRAAGHPGVPQKGPGSVTVPGALSGWAALIERYGTRTLDELLAPAIRIAAEGFPVSPIISAQWTEVEGVLAADPGGCATFLMGGTRAPRAGEWFRNTDLAQSFRAIARDGSDALYRGDLGARIVDELSRRGGFLTTDDLAQHAVRWVDPIGIDFRGYRVWELPPAGQGISVLQMLGMLDADDLAALGHNSAPYLHLLIEAKKLAFADLARHLGDAGAMTTSVDALLAPAYLAGRRASIDPRAAKLAAEPGVPLTAGETVFLAAADRYGNQVSFINSIFEHFGSGVVVPGTGFALQNRGSGFTMEEGSPNRVAPGKRPLHTLIPGFLTRDGEPRLAFGVMGGSMQPQGHLQLLLNMLVFGMDVQQAIDAPRFRHLSGRAVALEPMGEGVRRGLETLGHEVREGGAFGGGQAILKLERGWAAGSDPRKDGQAVGY